MSSFSEQIESDNEKKSSMWWLKSTVRTVRAQNPQITLTNVQGDITSPNKQLEIDISSSIDEFLEQDPVFSARSGADASEADIGSIIEEINRLASQSPIGNYENTATDKSVEEILQEAEKLYMESSKSFEQLSNSSKSRTSLDYSFSKSTSLSLNTPRSKKSTSSSNKSSRVNNKLDVVKDDTVQNDNDIVEANNNDDVKPCYTVEEMEFEDDFEKDESEEDEENANVEEVEIEKVIEIEKIADDTEGLDNKNKSRESEFHEFVDNIPHKKLDVDKNEEVQEMELSPDPEEEDVIEELRQEIEVLKLQLKEATDILKTNEATVNKQSFTLRQDLDTTIEVLKDTKEQNTALQVQLKNLTKTHQELKSNFEDLISSKKGLELKLVELESNYSKCRSELYNVKDNLEKITESENNLKKQLEIEKIQSKTSRLQNEKDAKCMLDLNRQVKEMERIIQRKHPDSVSALIVASKNDNKDNISTRTLLENRIKQLEQEASVRELQSTNVFSEIQDKFNLMKEKYERHIEDLEIHVNDLKNQLRSKSDTYDIYTQTYIEEPPSPKVIIQKDVFNIGIQTDPMINNNNNVVVKQPKNSYKKAEKMELKEDTHLIATIRGLQAELTKKEQLFSKLQKEMEEIRKTNRKLQKDRETNLRLASDKREKIYDKNHSSKSPDPTSREIEPIDSDLKAVKDEKLKLKEQLNKMEDDFQTLKTKRLQDLNILQEAHEREITTYMSNIGPMREQLDVQQISIKNLQSQLASAKEELAIITVERDHLEARLKNLTVMEAERGPEGDATSMSLQKKIAYLERRYEEREHRLRAIVHGLAQKQVTARDCAQCVARQQQLIGYKNELDQLLATLRYLQ